MVCGRIFLTMEADKLKTQVFLLICYLGYDLNCINLLVYILKNIALLPILPNIKFCISKTETIKTVRYNDVYSKMA